MTSPVAPQRPRPVSSNTGGIKDTIESILIAFILAFVFRAFIVEAFVIPTGSMAPTLMGAHMRYRCPDCGYVFDVNYTPPGEDEDTNIPKFADPIAEYEYGQSHPVYHPKTFNIRCPNCGFRIGDEEYSRGLDFGVPPAAVTSPPIHYGDRILVLKYQYLFGQPDRWDVVVFKSPDVPYGKTADEYDYSVNFIKRLVGKPGESVMIVDGDVYIAQDAGTNLASYKIQTKPYPVQEALWRLIYDDDYYPRGLKRYAPGAEPWRQPWTQQPGTADWDLGQNQQEGRTFKFNHADGAGEIYFDSTANTFANNQGNAQQHAFTDWLAYDITGNQTRRADTFNFDVDGSFNPVSDLKLQLIYDRQSGDGPVSLSLRKIDHTFRAELTPTGAKLMMRIGDGEEKQVGPTWQADVPKPWRIEFADVDYRVSLRINDKEVIATTPANYAPDLPTLVNDYKLSLPMPLPAVQISAANQNCVLSHISLWRDVYYINRGVARATPEDFPSHVVHLNHAPGNDEYFCLGDNSYVSEDGRYWRSPVDLPGEDLTAPAGVVPERFLMGKAFFVYWPAGFRPFASAPGVIPNFGEMRFIH